MLNSRTMKTRDKILKGAKEYLLKHGQEGFTVRAIAAEAGVNQGLIHHYFGSKENLIIELVDDVATAPFVEVKKHIGGLSGDDVRELLKSLLINNIEFTTLIVEFIYFSGRSERVKEKIREVLHERRDFITDHLGIDRVDEKNAFVAGIYGIILLRRIDPAIDIDMATRKLFERFNLV